MLYTEEEAIAAVKACIDVDKRESEIFISSRERISAGEYKAVIIARLLPGSINAQTLTKELMQLFVKGASEIVFRRSYLAVVAEKALRVIDFELEAIISLEN